jgi:hypothetical protein
MVQIDESVNFRKFNTIEVEVEAPFHETCTPVALTLGASWNV